MKESVDSIRSRRSSTSEEKAKQRKLKKEKKEEFNSKVEDSYRRYSVDPDTFFSENTPMINVQRTEVRHDYDHRGVTL